MLGFAFSKISLYPHLYPRFVFATPPGTHDAARMRWGGNPEELNPCSSPQHRLQPAWGQQHNPPWGKLHNSPRARLELPVRETGREYLLRGCLWQVPPEQPLASCRCPVQLLLRLGRGCRQPRPIRKYFRIGVASGLRAVAPSTQGDRI